MSRKPASSISRRMIPTICARRRDVPLQLLAAQVEPAVAQAQRLVDVLLVELERQRRRAADDLERLDLQLDLARRHVRVHRLGGCARRASPRRGGRTRSGSGAPARPPPARSSGLITSCVIPLRSRRSTKIEAAVVAAARDPAREGQLSPRRAPSWARRHMCVRQVIATVCREAPRGRPVRPARPGGGRARRRHGR